AADQTDVYAALIGQGSQPYRLVIAEPVAARLDDRTGFFGGRRSAQQLDEMIDADAVGTFRFEQQHAAGAHRELGVLDALVGLVEVAVERRLHFGHDEVGFGVELGGKTTAYDLKSLDQRFE